MQVADQITAAVKDMDARVQAFIEQSNAKITDQQTLGSKLQETMASLDDELSEFKDRMLAMEQQATAEGGLETALSPGQKFINSDEFKAYAEGRVERVRVNMNTITTGGAFVPEDQRNILIPGASRSLRIEQVIPAGTTTQPSVEYVRENVFTNAAAETAEAAAKPESAVTFAQITAPVRTVAHWIKLTKQVMDDAQQIASYIETRMRYGVDFRVDNQLLNGDGTGSNISGILDAGNFTVFTPGVGDDGLVSIRKAIAAVQVADYEPTAVIMHPNDVLAIDIIQGTDEHYVSANPRSPIQSVVWGLPIVPTNAMTAGNFALGAFDMAAMVWNRQGVMVEMSDSDDTNFTTNLVTMRAERRLALAIHRPASIVSGALNG